MFKSVAWLTFFSFSISLISLFFLLSKQSEHKASNIEDEEVLITVDVPISDFLRLATTGDEKIIDALILKIDKNWEERYEIMVLETLYFSNDSRVRSSLRKLLEKKAKLEIEVNFDKTFQYIWNKKESYSKDYFEFKAQLHQAIDSKFYKYFSGRADQSKIRLDEVRWGGVLQDGIPPLRNPLMIPANQATYLNDDDIVFGIAINGDVRAYPKRILAWQPVIGPLTNKGIQLDFLSVVTTTWGDWKTLHPNTSVLSTNTGHRRDYGEGVAYKNYFSTDELMFTIPKIDTSLKNKDEILSVRLPDVTTENYAISSKFLKKNPIYQADIANESYVVFTDKSGAHRTYFSKGIHFIDYDNKITATDNSGTIWKLQEEQLISSNGKVLERLATHNAFWFGYKAAFPNTILVK